MTKNKLTPLRPLFLVFVLLSAFFVTGKSLLVKWNIDQDLLISGNLLLLIVTLVSYLLLYRGVYSANPQAFIRAMYGSFILKFFVIAIAAFVYIMVVRKNVNKPALIICMFLYMVYTFIEVSVLLKLLKEKKNA